MAQRRNGSETARTIRAFLASSDGRAACRALTMRVREQLHSKLYRYEREQCAEWIDFGGEGGEA